MRFQVPLAAAFATLVILNSNAITTHYVDANGTNPVSPYITWATAATNIQDALNSSGFADTILVTNGIYQYGGFFFSGTNRVYANNSQTILSVNGPAFTFIKGYQVPGTTNGTSGVRCVYLQKGTTLSGFTLTNGATPNFDYGGGVNCAGATVSNCVIINNAAYDGGGGAYQGRLMNCSLIGNTASPASIGAGGGANGSVLINCLLANNFAGYIGGGALNSTLINCTLVSNTAAAYAGSVSGSTLRNCIVYYNSSYYTNADSNPGFSFSNCCLSFSPGSGANNFTNPPLFANLPAGDFHLSAASPGINAGNNSFLSNAMDLDGNPRIVGGIVDLGAYEFPSPIHYVKLTSVNPISPYTNWATAAVNIQDAVDAASGGDVVLVTNGVYGSGGRVVYGNSTNRVVVDKPITLQSVNGPATTAIQGYSFRSSSIRCTYLTNNAALVGFTLTNGGAMDSGDILHEQSGGGVWCEDSSVLVSNCVVVHGFAYQNGGGAYQGTLVNCVLAGNGADQYGGGAFQGTLLNCVLTNNSAYHGGGAASNSLMGCTLVKNFAQYQNLNSGGGAIYSSLSNCLIIANNSWGGGGGAAFSILIGCVISNNTGNIAGGGLCAGSANNCLISSNLTYNNGGGAYSNVLNNCLLKNNSATSGGGAYNSFLINCTVVSNTAPSGGGGIASGAVTNSIVYYNNGGNVFNTKNVAYTCTFPLIGDPSDISNAPLFVNQTAGDFHLQSSSPCINAGDNSSVTGNTDLDGNPRIASGTVDLGAYEFQLPPSPIFYASLQMPTNNPPGIILSWQSVNRVSYFIQRSGDLSAQPPFSTIQSNIVGQAGTTSYPDTSAVGDGPYFYRVGVQ